MKKRFFIKKKAEINSSRGILIIKIARIYGMHGHNLILFIISVRIIFKF